MKLFSDFSLYKPVVWLTDISSPEPRLGMERSPRDDLKKKIRISLRMQPHYEIWDVWSKKQGIKNSWAKIIEKGHNAESWYISTEPIPLTANELLKLENTVSGEVMLDFEAGLREYDCVVEHARGTMLPHFYDE